MACKQIDEDNGYGCKTMIFDEGERKASSNHKLKDIFLMSIIRKEKIVGLLLQLNLLVLNSDKKINALPC